MKPVCAVNGVAPSGGEFDMLPGRCIAPALGSDPIGQMRKLYAKFGDEVGDSARAESLLNAPDPSSTLRRRAGFQ